jgi:hypothetical protein
MESLAKGSQGDKQGRMFFNDYGIQDLTSVEIVGASVDTIRQLYYGIPNKELIERFDGHLGEYIQFELPVVGGRFIKQEFHLSRMGKVSRYRWKLQNNEMGIIILIGSYFSKMDKEGQHLKIELSPKFISQRVPESIMNVLDYINRQVLDDGIAKGCAVHLACDYQGQELPKNFLDLFQTHSRIIKTYDGLNTLDISNLSEAIASYGKGENRNYMIGKPGGVQVAVYDKTKEIIKSDKVDYFQQEWDAYTFGTYDKEKPVTRIEMRVSHTVVREIGQGIGVNLELFLAVSEYLTDIWRYALKINRLHIASDSKLLHPFWQLLMEDVIFTVPSKNVKICRKKKDNPAAIQRNVSMVLGNLVSICARDYKITAKQILQQLKCTIFYREVQKAYRERGMGEHDIIDFIEQGLKRRRMIGKAA